MTYRFSLTLDAQADLLRLYDFILERELERPGGGHLALGESALAAIQDGLATLRSSPFTCRKAAESPFLRERIIPFGATGHVALFETAGPDTVVIAAVRHQREDDYH